MRTGRSGGGEEQAARAGAGAGRQDGEEEAEEETGPVPFLSRRSIKGCSGPSERAASLLIILPLRRVRRYLELHLRSLRRRVRNVLVGALPILVALLGAHLA